MQILDVQNLVEEQSSKYRERLLSQFSRFTDLKPSFPIYYSIDGVNSTTELGTRDIMNYVAANSPIKYKKVVHPPIHLTDPILSSITFDETSGAYTDFEDDGLCLHSVLRPYPGDHFILPEFNPEVIFIVTNVDIRLIRGEDHYAFHYAVVPASRILNIEAQVVETYDTLYRNIGTDDKVLIKREDYNLLNEYKDSYINIVQRYLDEYYDKDYGYLKTPAELSDLMGYGTCKYLTKWLMKNRIIYFDEILNIIFAFEVVLPFEAKHNIIFNRTFPLNTFMKKTITQESVYVHFSSLLSSLFTMAKDEVLSQSTDFIHVSDTQVFEPTERDVLLYDTTFTSMIHSKIYTGATPIETIIAKFINDEEITPDDYNQVIDDYDVNDIFRFYFIPVVLLSLKVKIKALQLGTV